MTIFGSELKCVAVGAIGSMCSCTLINANHIDHVCLRFVNFSRLHFCRQRNKSYNNDRMHYNHVGQSLLQCQLFFIIEQLVPELYCVSVSHSAYGRFWA